MRFFDRLCAASLNLNLAKCEFRKVCRHIPGQTGGARSGNCQSYSDDNICQNNCSLIFFLPHHTRCYIKLTSSDCFFCQINSPKVKDSSSNIINNKEKQQSRALKGACMSLSVSYISLWVDGLFKMFDAAGLWISLWRTRVGFSVKIRWRASSLCPSTYRNNWLPAQHRNSTEPL